MKNLLTKRIITLISIAIIFSVVAISIVGVYLFEKFEGDIRGQEILPDLSVLAQCTIEYQEGNISHRVYENIIRNGVENHTRRYIIFGADQEVLLTTEELTNISADVGLEEALEVVFKGNEVFYELEGTLDVPIELIGMPIIRDDEILGAVFVLEDMVDLADVKNHIFIALIIAIIIVMPLVEISAYLVLMRIIKPIRNIVAVALSMIEGDFSIRADESAVGEIGFLGRTMNKMSLDLYRNISQLYVEKNRLQQVLNSLDEGMIAVDKQKNITHFNYSLLELLGLTEDEITGKSFYDIEEVTDEVQELNQAIKGNYPIIKNRTWRDSILKISIAPIENEQNKVVGAVIIVKDITDTEKLEMMRRDYVANVSHELRSPLTSIRGLIEPLMDDIVTNKEDVKRYYEIIYRESLRLSRLVDDIMELSRLQTNESVITKRYVNLNNILEMVYERYRIIDETIELVYKPLQLPQVFTNYDRIEQILVILIDNAFKFTPMGGKIEIQTELGQEAVFVRVVDTGQGILEEDIPFVFDRFYKSDKPRTQKGTGLGLSIAKEILQIMGEEIGVKSKVGEGTTFEFSVHLKGI